MYQFVKYNGNKSQTIIRDCKLCAECNGNANTFFPIHLLSLRFTIRLSFDIFISRDCFACESYQTFVNHSNCVSDSLKCFLDFYSNSYYSNFNCFNHVQNIINNETDV